MKITIGVVAYNEENNLPSLLRDIEAQSYPHADMEVVLADSMSTDDTRKVMQEWQKKKKDNFLDDFVSNPNPSYYICNKEELEIRNVQIN